MEIDRKAEIQVFEEAIQHRHEHRLQNNQGFTPVLSVFAAPGMGKSRFLDLLAKHVIQLKSDSPSCLLGSVVLAVSYDCVTGTPSNRDLANGVSPICGLAARILWSYFVQHGVQSQHFVEFCAYMQGEVRAKQLNPVHAIEAVMEHHGTHRILLLVDNLMNLNETAAEVLLEIGLILDKIAGFNCVVTSLTPGPVLRMLSLSGRPVKWIPLPPFTLQESLAALQPTLDKHAHPGVDMMMRLCVSDVGGHPRGLEVLQAALGKHLVQGMFDIDFVTAVVGEFRNFYTSMRPITETMVTTALRGELVDLTHTLDGVTVEQLIADGVFLKSEVVVTSPTGFVPRLSIMHLRVFVNATFDRQDAESKLVKSVRATALRCKTNFNFNDLIFFHAQWEVLTRLVGWTGQMTLAKFYGRREELVMPWSAKHVVIDFCEKTIGAVTWMNEQSIFSSCAPKPSCQAVYTARGGQPGFDMVTFERKVGGGYVAIFVETSYSEPRSTMLLRSEGPRKKLAECLKWLDSDGLQLKTAMKLKVQDCFLVLASWRDGNPTAIQKRESGDPESHILVLGRQDLTHLYTPTLISRLQLIRGDTLGAQQQRVHARA